MASPQHVEMEAAKLLQKLIHESKDEPAKLATKLFMICQHMKSSGKEHSLPYQVISRAMETVISQHGLDMNSLRLSRLPLASGTQIGDSASVGQKNKDAPDSSSPVAAVNMPGDGASAGSWNAASSSKSKEDNYGTSSLNLGASKDSKKAFLDNDVAKHESIFSSAQPAGLCMSMGVGDVQPRSVSETNSKLFEQESQDSRSPNLREANDNTKVDKQVRQKDTKKVGAKRKKADSSPEVRADNQQQLDTLNTGFDSKEKKPTTRGDTQSHFPAKVAAAPESQKLGIMKDAATRVSEKVPDTQWTPSFASADSSVYLPSGKMLERGASISRTGTGSMHMVQGGVTLGPPSKNVLGKADINDISGQDSFAKPKSETLQTDIHGDSSIHKDMNPQRSMIPNDLGKTSQTSASSDRPFKEHQLKQLRAQCLVFLAFRNCLVPRKLHLEIALGSSYTKEGGDIDGTHEGLNDHRRDMPLKEPSDSQEVSGVPARPNDTWEAEKEMPLTRISPGSSSNASLIETDVSSKGKDATFGNFNYVRPVESLPATSESMISNGFAEACVGSGDQDNQRVSDFQKPGTSDGFRNFNFNDTVKYGNSVTALGKSMEQDEENISDSNDMPVSSPKYTTTEKWIMEHCERKVFEEKNWALKLTKAEERIASCFDRLKENVSSSEDISAKTKSVIELKKLQLLQLQRRLQSDFLNDFFKPITSNMERLKSIKKHRHGRRLKQLERYEQKMKEERQKRIRERQKEFFSEVEAHKERLDEFFKIKRERCKGFHKYVKEFHKRKERLHREKIDRIQREKIFLLKTNDVEGYLRMVQDTKSDRVKQLLKETEKYLQKLGSKLQEAKVVASRFEMEMDDNRAINVEKNEISVDNEDESDQAQHYLESNEKYYLLAHSVKESINEQPTSLQGGKLREYQMNGLRWLVSLHNNHLNGILADEMGLGKTVQVISLICYLMEVKNSRGPFLVVVPSSVLPGWEGEFNFWAPSINCITYAGPPEVRRRLFKERIAQHKFNVLLTTYEYLMNKNDRPRLSKLHWHYLIIDEGHRIKNASCKLNADLKHFQSSYRLLLTGTPLQNNLEELWALLNFLLPNIFNSSEDFSQWFNKPFESGVDNSPDEALLSEEENLLIINRLHQVLRPFVLRRLKHKVANELPEKIERLIRCDASAYQKLLMKRVEDNLGSLGSSKGRSVHNSVMELRNICNHPYLSQLHAEEVNSLIPRHYLPPIVRLCGKLEMLDRLLPKLKATDHRVLLFSTMTRLLDIMEEYLCWKRYKYLRLDGHTSGNERGALIEEFNRPDSQAFIFLLSLRAGGVGVNLQAADTVIIFDTDWNPQVDLQAQARAHRLGQKKDVLVLRLETVRTVEEQVRAAAEHKLGVANQSITAGFFDNNTSAEDRREYLESLLREGKKEETTAVLDDDVLNDVIARSGSEIDIFESIDRQRHEKEMAAWQSIRGECNDGSEPLPPMPPRLVTDDDLKVFYQAMQVNEASSLAMKRKSEYLGGLDTQHYGRGKRAREVRSYEDQWTEEEFEKLCQVDPPDSPEIKVMPKDSGMTTEAGGPKVGNMDAPFLPSEELPPLPSKESQPSSKESPLLCKELEPLQSYEPLPLQLKELPLPSKELQPPLSEEPLQQCKLVKQQPCEPPQPSKEQVLPAKESQPSGTVPRPPPPVKRGRGRPRRVPVNVSPSPRVAYVPSETPGIAPVPSETPRVAPVPSESPRVAPAPSETPRAAPTPSETPRVAPALSETPRVAPAPSETPKISPMPSETVSKQEMERQKDVFGSSVTIPVSSHHVKAQTINFQHGAGTVPSSLTSPSPVLPPQMMGQSQKAQSGSGRPRKRAKKLNADSPAVGPEVNPVPLVSTQIDMATVTSNATSQTFAFAQQMERLIRPSGPSNATSPLNFELNQIPGIPNVVFLVPVLAPNASLGPVSGTQAAAFQTQSLPIASIESKQHDSGNLCVNRPGQQLKVSHSPTVSSSLAQDLKERRTLRVGSSDMASDEGQKSSEKPQTSHVQSTGKDGTSFDAPKVEPPNSSSKPSEADTRQDHVAPNTAPILNSQDEKNDEMVEVPLVEVPLVEVPLPQKRSAEGSRIPAPAKRGFKKRGPVSTRQTRQTRSRSAAISEGSVGSSHAHKVELKTDNMKSNENTIVFEAAGSAHAHVIELKTDNNSNKSMPVSVAAVGSGHVHVVELKIENNKSDGSTNVSEAGPGSGAHVDSKTDENESSANVTPTDEQGKGEKQTENATSEQASNLVVKQSVTMSSQKLSSALEVACSVPYQSETGIMGLSISECSVGSKDGSDHIINEKSRTLIDGTAVQHLPEQHSETASQVLLTAVSPITGLTSEKQESQSPEQNTAGEPHIVNESCAPGDRNATLEAISVEPKKTDHVLSETGYPGEKAVYSEVVETAVNNSCVVSVALTDTPSASAVVKPEMTITDSGSKQADIQNAETNDNCSTDANKKADGVAGLSRSDVLDIPNVAVVTARVKSMEPVKHADNPIHTIGEEAIGSGASVHSDKEDESVGASCIEKKNVPAISPEEAGPSHAPNLPVVSSTTVLPCEETKSDVPAQGASGSGASVHPDKADESVGASCIQKKNVSSISLEEAGPSHAPNLPFVSSTTALPCEETKSDVPAQGAGKAPEEAGPSDGLDLPSVASNTSLPFEETRSDQHALEVLTSSQNNQDDLLSEATCIRSEDKKTLLSEAVPSFATESHNSDPATCTEGQHVLDVISDKAGRSEGADLPCISSNTPSSCEETKLHKYSFEGADPVDIRKEALEVSTSSQNVQDDGSLSKATCLGSGDENMLVSGSGPSVETLVSEAGSSVATEFHISHPLSEDGSEPQAAAFADSNADNNCEPQAAAFDDSNREPQAAAFDDNNCEPQAAAVDSNCEPRDAVDGNCSEPQAASVDEIDCEPQAASVDDIDCEPQAAAVDDNNCGLQAATIDDCNYEPQAAAVDNNCEPRDAALVDDCSEPQAAAVDSNFELQTAAADNNCEPQAAAVDNNCEPRRDAAVVDACSEPQAAAVDDSNFELQTAAVDNNCEPQAAAVANNCEPRDAAVVDDCSAPQTAAVDDGNFELQTAAVDYNCEPQAAAAENNCEPQDAAVDDDRSEPQAAAVDNNCEPQDATVDTCELQDAAVGDSKEICTRNCIGAEPFEIQSVCRVGEDCSNTKVTNISETDNAAPTRMSHFGVKETDLPAGNSEPFSSPTKEEDEKVNATSGKDSALSLESNDIVKIPQACVIEKEDEEDEKMNATSNDDSAISVESNDTVNITHACSEEKPDKDEKVGAVSNKDSAASIESIDVVNISQACTEEEGGEDEKENADSDKDSAVCIESIDTVNVPQASTEEKEDEEHEKVNAAPNKESAVSIESNDTTNIPQVCSEEKDESTRNPDKALFSLGEEMNIVEISKDSVVSTSESLDVVEEKKVAETVTLDSTSPSNI